MKNDLHYKKEEERKNKIKEQEGDYSKRKGTVGNSPHKLIIEWKKRGAEGGEGGKDKRSGRGSKKKNRAGRDRQGERERRKGKYERGRSSFHSP